MHTETAVTLAKNGFVTVCDRFMTFFVTMIEAVLHDFLNRFSISRHRVPKHKALRVGENRTENFLETRAQNLCDFETSGFSKAMQFAADGLEDGHKLGRVAVPSRRAFATNSRQNVKASPLGLPFADCRLREWKKKSFGALSLPMGLISLIRGTFGERVKAVSKLSFTTWIRNQTAKGEGMKIRGVLQPIRGYSRTNTGYLGSRCGGVFAAIRGTFTAKVSPRMAGVTSLGGIVGGVTW
jgi:hypothetical protein